MGYQRITHFTISLFHLLTSCLIHCSNTNLDESLDTILHDHAFRVMIRCRPHTGALYDTSLPSNLAGIKVSIVRLRSTTLWKRGANFSDFIIPPKTIPTPYVKRLVIVYHNLGNQSSLYYNLSGYSLATPVVGFLAYNASSNIASKLELNTKGNPISIQFKNSTQGEKQRRTTKCATFGGMGGVSISEMSIPNVCYRRSEGHFSVVVPLLMSKKQRVWVIGFVGGSVGVVLVALGGAVAVRSLVGKRSEEMEKEADEAEELQTSWISASKMPRAEVTRTQPTLETTTLPNPKLSWYA